MRAISGGIRGRDGANEDEEGGGDKDEEDYDSCRSHLDETTNKTTVYSSDGKSTAGSRAEEVTLESPHAAKGAGVVVELRIGGRR